MLHTITDFIESVTMWGWVIVTGVISFLFLVFWHVFFKRMDKKEKAMWHNRLLEDEEADILINDGFDNVEIKTYSDHIF